jgi:hypothetical protein
MPNSRFWIHWIDQIGYLTKTRAVDSKFGTCWFRWEELCHLRVLLCNYNGLKHNSFILLCVILSLKECTVKFSWSLSMRSFVGFCVWLSFPVTAICHHLRNTWILGECESHTLRWFLKSCDSWPQIRHYDLLLLSILLNFPFLSLGVRLALLFIPVCFSVFCFVFCLPLFGSFCGFLRKC